MHFTWTLRFTHIKELNKKLHENSHFNSCMRLQKILKYFVTCPFHFHSVCGKIHRESRKIFEFHILAYSSPSTLKHFTSHGVYKLVGKSKIWNFKYCSYRPAIALIEIPIFLSCLENESILTCKHYLMCITYSNLKRLLYCWN